MKWHEFFKLQWEIYKQVSPYVLAALILIPIVDQILRTISPKYKKWTEKEKNETSSL